MILVVAFTYQEFRRWRREHDLGPADARFLPNPDLLRGCRPPDELVFTPDARLREDYLEFRREAVIAGFL